MVKAKVEVLFPVLLLDRGLCRRRVVPLMTAGEARLNWIHAPCADSHAKDVMHCKDDTKQGMPRDSRKSVVQSCHSLIVESIPHCSEGL